MDFFARKIDTRENRIATMRASAVVCVIDATRKRLPRTIGNKWAHRFLDDHPRPNGPPASIRRSLRRDYRNQRTGKNQPLQKGA